MRTLTVKRPKGLERYYSEKSLKIYLNGTLASRIQQDETLEMFLEDNITELQVKSNEYCSRIVKLEQGKNPKIEVYINPSLAFPSFLIVTFSIPFLLPLLINAEGIWPKMIIAGILLIIIVQALYRYSKVRRNGILITGL